MTRDIVVAFRMPPAGMTVGPEGAYITRARSMCSRGEALGGRLVAWSAALLAMAWDPDSIEEALLLATSIREESLSVERAWSCGMAEGELEQLAPDGARMQLAWGEVLIAAASLARIARGGEVLVDGDLRALRAGQLSLLGSRAATDAGLRVRGWRLDLEHPWKRAPEETLAGADMTDRYVLPEPDSDGPSSVDLNGTTQEMPALTAEELANLEILQLADATAEPTESPPPSQAQARRESPLADRLRRITAGAESSDAVEVLAELRRARTHAEGAPAATRCQASLALAMGLAMAGRLEDALLEAVDALARAREAHDPKAVGACMALLAKLYAGVGRAGEAQALRESSGAS
ncbi:MAG TPA: hypothetical protein VGG39_22450 [Polyangiaceae bacterium]